MPQELFTAPSLESMNALLPAFQFMETLASSSLGAVYFANQRSQGREVAIKVFSPKFSDDASFQKSLEHASAALDGLHHPNLIEIFGSGRVEDMLFQVMEFVPGNSLARSTRGQAIEFEQAMVLFDGICEGISYAHRKALVHGNLDSLSILLNQQAVPKVGGFGFERPVHTAAATDVPTHCKAPELLNKSGPATERSDVYSLGAIFRELITGTPLGRELAPSSKLPPRWPEINAVLEMATAIDPAKRMANVGSFHAKLKEAAAGSQPKSSEVKRPKSPATRHVSAAGKSNVVAFDTKILLKIAIIIGLLFAINFTWKATKKARADREEQNLEIIAKAEKARIDAVEEAAEKRRLKLAERAAQTPVKTVEPKFVPKVETPEQSLARLKISLGAGRRAEMPVGSVRKGDSDYFFVSEAMSWQEAAWFAEQHGGHLAMPDGDLSWMPEKLTNGEISWLGAGRSGETTWMQVDGTPWTPTSSTARSGPYLAIRQGGDFVTGNEEDTFPSVIQWRSDGSNPGTLSNTLAATRASLSGNSPVFPPGTVASGSRHYLFVQRPVTWEQAGKIAEIGGAHLMVPSDIEEIARLDEMTKRRNARLGIWFGGAFEGGVWQWTTGEPWTKAMWMVDAEAGQQDSATVMRPAKGWDAKPRGDLASGFIIEWSADRNADKAGETVPAASAAAAELQARVKELVLAADQKRTDALVDNVKKFRWDLDAYVKNLNKSGQEEWSPQVDVLKDCVKANRIMQGEIATQGITISPEMEKLINYHVKKQTELDTQFAGDVGKIRDAFAVKMAEIQSQAETAGQTKIQLDSAKSIAEAKNLEDWVGSFSLSLRGVIEEEQ